MRMHKILNLELSPALTCYMITYLLAYRQKDPGAVELIKEIMLYNLNMLDTISKTLPVVLPHDQ